MPSVDGGGSRNAVYLAFCNSTCARNAVGVRQLWHSLPNASKLLLILVLAETSLWVANLASAPRRAQECIRDTPGCSFEPWQITITTAVVQLCNACLRLDAVGNENPLQLLAATGFSIITGLLWLIYMTSVALGPTLWRLGVSLGFVTITILSVWLTYLTHQQSGWRVHSRIPCDFRRKHAKEKQHLYQAVLRFRTLLRLSCCTVLINAVSGLLFALRRPQAALQPAAGPPAIMASNLSAPANSELLAAVGLYGLPLAWLAITYLAVRRNNSKLELLSNATFLLLLSLPAFPLYCVFGPQSHGAWPGHIAVQALLVAVPLATWMVLHVATWCSMRQVLRLFRSPNILQLLVDATHDDMNLQQDVPEQLQPLLQGAWLVKGKSISTARVAAGMGKSALSTSSKYTVKHLDSISAQQSAANTKTWVAPTSNIVTCNHDRSSSSSRLQTYTCLVGRALYRAIINISGSNEHWRFFQLSVDLTTLRWAWNKYVLLYYVDSLTVDASELTITLHMALDPDLTLAFKDPRVFDQWESALQLLLHMLTGAAPGSIQAGMYPATPPAAPAAAQTPPHLKTHLSGLLGQASSAAGSGQIAGFQSSETLTQAHTAAVDLSPISPSPISQHSLVMSALNVQHRLEAALTEQNCSGRTIDNFGGLGCHDDGVLHGPVYKEKTSLNSFLRASRRDSLNDPHALRLQKAQAVVEMVTRQLSNPQNQGPAAGGSSPGPLTNSYMWHHHHQQQQQQQQQHTEPQHTQQYLQPEHKAWLQRCMHSSHSSSLTSSPTSGRPVAPDGAAAAAAAAGNAGEAADALARQLRLAPCQLSTRLQHQQASIVLLQQQSAGVGQLAGGEQAAAPQLCSNASYPFHMGMGPFRTPPGLIRQMHLNSEQQHSSDGRWQQVGSSSEEGSAAVAAAWQGMTGAPAACSGSHSGYTGASLVQGGQQLSYQGSFNSGSEPSHGNHQVPVAHMKGSTPSRLQQSPSPTVHTDLQHQRQQQSAPAGQEGPQRLQRGPAQSGVTGRGELPQLHHSPEAGMTSQSSLPMFTTATPNGQSTRPTYRTEGRVGEQNTTAQNSRDNTNWCQQQQQLLLPVRQLYEHQYSQPPAPNIYGMYTSAALRRRGQSPLSPAAGAPAGSSKLIRANSMPVAMNRHINSRSPEAACGDLVQHAECGGMLAHPGAPVTPCSLYSENTAVSSNSVTTGGHFMYSAFMKGSLQPLEQHKPAALWLSGCFMPPVLDELVSDANAIPAVWSDEQHLASDGAELAYAAGSPAQFAHDARQSANVSRHMQLHMLQPMQARSFDVQSNIATFGGSVLQSDSPDSRSHCSAEPLEALHHPTTRHTRTSNASVNTISSSSGTAAPVGNAGMSMYGTALHTQQNCADYDSHDVQSIQQPTYSQMEGLHATLSTSAVTSPCSKSNSTQATVGSTNTSRPVDSRPAGVPSFSVVMAQVEGSTWADEVAVVGSGSVPRTCRMCTSDAADLVEPVPAAPCISKGLMPSSGAAAAGAEGQQSSVVDKPKSSGVTWFSSWRRIIATVAQAVKGRRVGARHSSEPKEVDKGGIAAISWLSQPAATSSRHILSANQVPTPAGAAAHPVRRPPRRSPSVPTAIRESASFRRSGSFTVTGQRTYIRRGSFADSFRASKTDGLLTRGASRTSIGNVTAYGWSDWGRSTLTDFDSLVELDSSVVLSDDGRAQDLQVAEACAAAVQMEFEPGWTAEGYNAACTSSHAGLGAFHAAAVQHGRCLVGSAAKLEVSSSGSSRRSSDTANRPAGSMQLKPALATTDITSENLAKAAGPTGISHTTAASPDVQLHQQEHVTAGFDHAYVQGQLTSAMCLGRRPTHFAHDTLVHQQLQQQLNDVVPASRQSAGSMSGAGSSAAVGQPLCTGHLGLGRAPSVLDGRMPLLPVLQEAPSSAELDTQDDNCSPAEQQHEAQEQQPPSVLSSFSGDRGQQDMSDPVATAMEMTPWLIQGLQPQEQVKSPLEQDNTRLHSFTFSASVQHEHQQPTTLQAAYLLAKSTGTGDGGSNESVPSAVPQIHQQQEGRMESPRASHSASFKQAGWLVNNTSGSIRMGAPRPAVLQISVSDSAEAVGVTHPGAGLMLTAAGGDSATEPQCSGNSACLDSPQGLGRLQVKVPVGRRSSVQGQAGPVHPLTCSTSLQSNLGIAQHYQQHQQQLIAQQLPYHDDGYAVNSPNSLMSFNSHTSIFNDTSPRTGRTWRQSMVSAGQGASSQLANNLSMTYSGWSAYSGASNNRGNSSSFKRGMPPQVPVELVEWHSLQLGRQIGHGAEGCVYEARYRDAPVAVKEAPDTYEIDMYLAAGVHDNLVGLRGLCHKEDNTWCLLLEYCGRGTLDTLLHHSSSPLPRARHQVMLNQKESSSTSIKPPGTAEDHHQQQPGRQDLVKLLPFMRSIARGLLHLHSRRPAVLHRDIKPANIFIGHGMVMKIGDFGMSRLIFPPTPDVPGSSYAGEGASDSRSSVAGGSHIVGMRSSIGGVRSTSGHGGLAAGDQHGTPHAAALSAGGPNRTLTPGVVGTICYSAPEVLDAQLQAPHASVEHVLKADVYSFGVTIWEMIERRRPFNGMDGMQICALWIADPARMALPPLTVEEDASDCDRRVLAGLQELVRDCTAFDPDKRPGMSQVLAKIRHTQRMYDPKVVAAEAARVSRALARAEAAVTHNAEAAPSKVSSGYVAGPDYPVLPTANLHDDNPDMQQQQKEGALDAAQFYAPQEAQAPTLSMGPPVPGVTDPAVAAAIAAAAARATVADPTIKAVYRSNLTYGSMSSWRPEDRSSGSAGAHEVDVLRGPLHEGINKRRPSDRGQVMGGSKRDSKTESGGSQHSRVLLHSRSLPSDCTA